MLAYEDEVDSRSYRVEEHTNEAPRISTVEELGTGKLLGWWSWTLCGEHFAETFEVNDRSMPIDKLANLPEARKARNDLVALVRARLKADIFPGAQ